MPVQSKKGFTLIELMVVISIIAILTTIGLVTYTNAQISTRDARRKQDLKALQSALELYKQTNGGYPPTTDLSGNGIAPCNIAGGWCYSHSNNPWIPALTFSYINTPPHDPSSDGTNPWGNTEGYAYASPANCPQGSGQWFILIAHLENSNDPDRVGAKGGNVNWCTGVINTVSSWGWSPNIYYLTNLQN